MYLLYICNPTPGIRFDHATQSSHSRVTDGVVVQPETGIYSHELVFLKVQLFYIKLAV